MFQNDNFKISKRIHYLIAVQKFRDIENLKSLESQTLDVAQHKNNKS